MPFDGYRDKPYYVYYYPMRADCFKHIAMKQPRGGKPDAVMNTAAILEELEEGAKLEESLSRSRRTIRDIILCNRFTYFCTFTFNGEKVNRYSYPACKKKITQLFNNYKRKSPDFKYLIVPEFHKDGGIHFHGLVHGIRPQDLTVPDMIYKRDKRTGALTLVPNTQKYVDWKYYSDKLGFFSCSHIKNYEKCARYVSKYITKDLINMQSGSRIFFCSLELNRPELVFGADLPTSVFSNPDYENEFVRVKETFDDYGILGGNYFFLERAGLLAHERDDGGPLIEADIFFPRLTGNQLKMGVRI
jgi:hypothetical protein